MGWTIIIYNYQEHQAQLRDCLIINVIFKETAVITPKIENYYLKNFFVVAGDDEVTFDPGDIITDIEQVDEGWWMGDVNGKRGLFPSNYAELIN